MIYLVVALIGLLFVPALRRALITRVAAMRQRREFPVRSEARAIMQENLREERRVLALYAHTSVGGVKAMERLYDKYMEAQRALDRAEAEVADNQEMSMHTHVSAIRDAAYVDSFRRARNVARYALEHAVGSPKGEGVIWDYLERTYTTRHPRFLREIPGQVMTTFESTQTPAAQAPAPQDSQATVPAPAHPPLPPQAPDPAAAAPAAPARTAPTGRLKSLAELEQEIEDLEEQIREDVSNGADLTSAEMTKSLKDLAQMKRRHATMTAAATPRPGSKVTASAQP